MAPATARRENVLTAIARFFIEKLDSDSQEATIG